LSETRSLKTGTRHQGPGYAEALEAARYLEKRAGRAPRVGIVLGSGLGDLTRDVKTAQAIPYRSVPHFPPATVAGHRGALRLGTWAGVQVAVLEGRLHLYEGYAPAEVVFPTRVLALWGVRTLVLTCAAGGIAPQARPGHIVIISDHLNFQAANPLAGPHDGRWGVRFPDMGAAYDGELRRRARRAAACARLKCSEGVYAAVLGPSYETPAEIRALKRLGAAAVGMSTVPEVLAARQLGVPVLALAVITNRAAGLGLRPLSHEEVLEVGKKAARNLRRLFAALLPTIPLAPPAGSTASALLLAGVRGAR